MSARQFLDAIAAHGLTPPESIEPGRMVRFPGAGKAAGNRSGWAHLFPDGRGGAFGDWSAGLSATWQAERQQHMTQAERDRFSAMVTEARAAAAAELMARQENARRIASRLWQRAVPADPAHPYLAAKRVRPHIARQMGDRLVLPIVTVRGDLSSLQYIWGDGRKQLLAGGAKKGRLMPVRWRGESETIAVCEGFSTAATLAELEAKASVVAAIDCGNLTPVCVALRRIYPSAKIYVCGDDDRQTPGNPGRTAANQAASACGGTAGFPPWDDAIDSPLATDWNDWARARGRLGREVARYG